MEWQPIDMASRDDKTAPWDGSDVILWPGIRRNGEPAVGAWLGTTFGKCWIDWAVGHHNGLWVPTHWMPFPPPPAS